MVAVCGKTGTCHLIFALFSDHDIWIGDGKSSVINAILGDNIVPTNGMRACTAVVTEISYHKNKTIEADVSFIKLEDWREEIGVLVEYLTDHNENSEEPTSEAIVAWSKLQAVYPSIDRGRVGKMTVDQILARDTGALSFLFFCSDKANFYLSGIVAMLGTTIHIAAENSQAFAKNIGRYVDSKDQESGNIRDRVRSKNKRLEVDPDAALWPLISRVQVYCSAKALSSGVTLVDLPGPGDTNRARNDTAENCKH